MTIELLNDTITYTNLNWSTANVFDFGIFSCRVDTDPRKYRDKK